MRAASPGMTWPAGSTSCPVKEDERGAPRRQQRARCVAWGVAKGGTACLPPPPVGCELASEFSAKRVVSCAERREAPRRPFLNRGAVLSGACSDQPALSCLVYVYVCMRPTLRATFSFWNSAVPKQMQVNDTSCKHVSLGDDAIPVEFRELPAGRSPFVVRAGFCCRENAP